MKTRNPLQLLSETALRGTFRVALGRAGHPDGDIYEENVCGADHATAGVTQWENTQYCEGVESTYDVAGRILRSYIVGTAREGIVKMLLRPILSGGVSKTSDAGSVMPLMAMVIFWALPLWYMCVTVGISSPL